MIECCNCKLRFEMVRVEYLLGLALGSFAPAAIGLVLTYLLHERWGCACIAMLRGILCRTQRVRYVRPAANDSAEYMHASTLDQLQTTVHVAWCPV